MKLVINCDWGGFSLSNEAEKFISKRKGKKVKSWEIENNRNDPDLIAAVEELGDSCNTKVSKLRIVEIPDGYDYKISDYDGVETVYAGKKLIEIDGWKS